MELINFTEVILTDAEKDILALVQKLLDSNKMTGLTKDNIAQYASHLSGCIMYKLMVDHKIFVMTYNHPLVIVSEINYACIEYALKELELL